MEKYNHFTLFSAQADSNYQSIHIVIDEDEYEIYSLEVIGEILANIAIARGIWELLSTSKDGLKSLIATASVADISGQKIKAFQYGETSKREPIDSVIDAMFLSLDKSRSNNG